MPTVSKKVNAKHLRSSSVEESDVEVKPQVVKKSKPSKAPKAKSVTPDELSEGDSSIVEIVEPAPVTPIKKPKFCKKVIGLLDDPVQIISRQTGVMSRHLGRRLSFGSIDEPDVVPESPEAELPPAMSSTGKRSRKPSEKAIASHEMAKALDALDAEDSSDLPERISPKKKTKTSDAKLPQKRTKQKGVADKHAEDITAPSTKHKSHGKKQSAKSKGKKCQVTPNSIQEDPSDNTDAEGSDDVEDTAKEKQSSPVHWPPSDSGDHPVEQGPKNPTNRVVENLPICTLYNYNRQKQDASGSTAMEFSKGEESHLYSARMNLIAIAEDLPPYVTKSLSLALEFNTLTDTPFINLARATVAATAVNSQNHLVISGKPSLAISLFPGCVMSCNLIHPTHNNKGQPIKRITVIPFDDQYDMFINYLGSKYKCQTLYGPVQLATHISIGTRKKGAPVFSSSGHSDYGTPVKVKSKYFTRKPDASTSNAAKTWYQKQLPLFLDHEVDVPIYDAREVGFSFDHASFEKLRELPLYHKPGWPTPTDLPDHALVVIGHTVNTFFPETSASAEKPDHILSLNLHFVVLLGILASDDDD